MSWLQIAVEVPTPLVARVQAAFESVAALSTTVEAAGANDRWLEERPSDAPAWRAARVTALFPADTDAAAVREVLQLVVGAAAMDTVAVTTLEDQPWTTRWLEHFHPIAFERFHVVPASGPPVLVNRPRLAIDPGEAFGSGTHTSTALCLEWIDRTPLDGRLVIDYGCGSGILAIAAALLGARRVWGTDIDARALEVSRANAERNGVADRTVFVPPAELPAGPVDVVLANLLLGTLIELAPELEQRVQPGGTLVLSGVLVEQAADLCAAFAAGFDVACGPHRDDWTLVVGVRR